MEAFKIVIWIISIISTLVIIVLVLLQHGKSTDAGATFGLGTGNAQRVFGSDDNANFLSRVTIVAATFFFTAYMAMVYIHSNTTRHGLDFSNIKQSLSAKMQQAPTNGGKTDTIPIAPKQR